MEKKKMREEVELLGKEKNKVNRESKPVGITRLFQNFRLPRISRTKKENAGSARRS